MKAYLIYNGYNRPLSDQATGQCLVYTNYLQAKNKAEEILNLDLAKTVLLEGYDSFKGLQVVPVSIYYARYE